MSITTELEKLSEPSRPLEFLTDQGPITGEGEEIIAKLKAVMEEDNTLLAVAAPQIGIMKRIFCIRFNEIIKTFINPIIIKKVGSSIAPETFSSMPGKEILISRPDEITIVYYNDDFKYEENKLLAGAARVFDQMTQLLDGVTPDQLGLVSDVEQDGSLADCSEEEIKELTEIYKQFVTAKQKQLEQMVKEDETLSAQYAQLKATEQIINGRITIVEPEEETKHRMQLAKLSKQAELSQKAAKQKVEHRAYINRILKKKGKKKRK